VKSFVRSPDGTTIVFVSKADSPQPAAGGDLPSVKTDLVHITRIRFRADGTPGFLDDKRTHIWCAPTAGGQPRQVTSGAFNDNQPAWLHDSRQLAFVSNRTADHDYNCASEIWTVDTSGGEPRCVAGGDSAYFFRPAWSPDGVSIAVSGHEQAATAHATNKSVWLVPAGGGERRNLTPSLDRSVGDFALSDTAAQLDPGLVWSPDGAAVYFQVSDAGMSISIGSRPVAGTPSRSSPVTGESWISR
jgi:Tol biopolymer transport system component